MTNDADATVSLPDDPANSGPELPERLMAKLRLHIPGYELLEKMATGGQATVYRAKELTSGMTVAVKVLNGGPHADPAARDRLKRETATLKAMNHPNIVCVIDSGRTPTGLDYLVMNFVDGRTLDALWKDRKFAAAVAPEPPARLRLFKRICDIVQSAHLKGITHRDLSPSNILVTAAGEPHVLDFGLASTAFNDLLSPHGHSVSVTGQFIGKIKYAAPEQAKAGREQVDIRTDVYALGVILYQILTNGAFPYEVVGNLVDVLNHIIHTRPLPPSAVLAARQEAASGDRAKRKDPPLVNETIEAVVLKALEKDPARRYQSAGELAGDIDLYLAGRPTTAILRRRERPSARRWRAKRVAVVIAVGLTLGVLMNARVILNWIGLTSLAALLGAAPAPGPDLTSRQQNLLMQLADAEANIQAINRALRLTGYKVGQAYDKIDSNQGALDLRNSQGGGPVRWDAFYGKTAKEYARNGWGDRRPQQFAFIDKMNKDRMARASEQIGALAKDQGALLDRRRKHEADQARLWATIAFEQIKDREIAFEPICRLKLRGAEKRGEALRPFVLFLRTADRASEAGLEMVETNPEGTFAGINSYVQAAYKSLLESLAGTDIDSMNDADRKRVEGLKGLCKQIAEECKVAAEDYVNALDRDRAKEDNSKLAFRQALQEAMTKFASEVGDLDAQIAATAQGWNVAGEQGKESPDKLPAMAEGNVLGKTDTSKSRGGGADASAIFPIGSKWVAPTPARMGSKTAVTWTVVEINASQIKFKARNAASYSFYVVDVTGNDVTVLRHLPGRMDNGGPQDKISDIHIKGTVSRDTLTLKGTQMASSRGRLEFSVELHRE